MDDRAEKSMGRFPSIADLPNQILVDIISRLPIKSVILCRSVCKSFLYVISQDSEFPLLQLSRSTPELILWAPGSNKMTLVDYDDEQAHQVKFRFAGLSTMKIVNSSRGLLCLRPRYYSFEDVCVLNPLTLEYTLIPNRMTRERELNVWVGFGLGYSPLSGKYKVIKLTKSRNSIGQKSFLTDIYTLGTPPSSSSSSSSHWRRIENAPIDEFTCCFSTFLNGSLHWIQNEGRSIYKYDHMICFDFDNETYKKIDLPGPFEGGQERDRVDVVSICVFEGCLSVCVLSPDEESLDVWVMREYGVRESWVREIVLEIPYFLWTAGSFPVKYMNSGKTDVLIYVAEYDLLTYNLVERRIVRRNGFPSQNFESKAFIHVPNLISLQEQLVEVHHLKSTRSKTWRRCDGWSVSPPYEENSSLSSSSSEYSSRSQESSSTDELISSSPYHESDNESVSSLSQESDDDDESVSSTSQESA
ncbi:F-box protein At3g07870-like [Impatiens glandulifera]|uniref:F-box protein At3g07870-like n=1 Tax=Impatiens glandulifera TaxID=253017 RepID=UPI001FB09E32|nr:F-box protein At3g07870-like [Impatiens glandulifera]